MNKITEGSKWKSEFDNKIVVLCSHEYGIMLKYIGNGRVHALSHEEFLDFFTPIPKIKKVFRLWKFLESNELTSKDKAEAVWNGYPQKLEGKTQEEMKDEYDLNDAWLVEEEIK